MKFLNQDQNRIESMRRGGKKLSNVKKGLTKFTQVGTSFEAIEAEAQRLIKSQGAKPSFSTVPGYDWATCIMKNDELCHGIPKGKNVEDGDIITIDVGLIENGFHLDTTISFIVGQADEKKVEFLSIGKKSLSKAIEKAKAGNTVYDISRAMEKVVQNRGWGAVYQLTGHGIGRELHQDPSIPCVADKADKRIKLKIGQTIAIEIMYSMGDPFMVQDEDGWTYRSQDGSLTGMFEETVLITDGEPEILTA